MDILTFCVKIKVKPFVFDFKPKPCLFSALFKDVNVPLTVSHVTLSLCTNETDVQKLNTVFGRVTSLLSTRQILYFEMKQLSRHFLLSLRLVTQQLFVALRKLLDFLYQGHIR